ncbi:hypothetical protein R1flu_026312 [Riccia fluitans]|uniref:Uncharacterized protein n=1 Tax=Riccia fluitans TaxID=41844 RepID=A0ABD1XG67_9MARC
MPLWLKLRMKVLVNRTKSNTLPFHSSESGGIDRYLESSLFRASVFVSAVYIECKLKKRLFDNLTPQIESLTELL